MFPNETSETLEFHDFSLVPVLNDPDTKEVVNNVTQNYENTVLFGQRDSWRPGEGIWVTSRSV